LRPFGMGRLGGLRLHGWNTVLTRVSTQQTFLFFTVTSAKVVVVNQV